MKKLIQPIRCAVQACFMLGLFLPFMPDADVVGEKIWLSVLFVGVFFCGWLCPFGTIQEWIFWSAKKLKIKQYRVPVNIQQYLQISRYLFYAVSALGITFFFLSSRYYFNHNLVMGMLTWLSGLTLAAFLIASVFIERPFCNYFCMKGAADGVMSVVRPLSIAREENQCIHCHLCDKSCPMNILVESHNFIRHPNCINCFKCISACPKNCLKYKLIKLQNQRRK